MLNSKTNPKIVQSQAGHKQFRTTMVYGRPDEEEMGREIERTFVKKTDLTDKDKVKLIVDKYLLGELTPHDMNQLLEVIRPKQLNHKSELSGYV